MDVVGIQTLLSLAVGVGLAAAAGLRVFVPLLLLGAAARLDLIALTDGFEWLSSGPALAALGAATFLEIGAYYFPWLDNLLDVVAAPAAVMAGIVVTAAVTTDLPPAVRWAAAIIAGGGTAGAVQGLTTVARLKSTALTGGLGNPVLATIEWIGSVATSLVVIAVPALAILIIAGFVLLLAAIWRRLTSPDTRPSPR
jgi:hypothetical protein